MATSTKVVSRKSKKEILKKMLPQLLEKRLAMRQKARQRKSGIVETLTVRQTQVVKLLLDGYGCTEIAEVLGISVYTVRNHVQRIYRIFGVRGKRGLISSLSRDEIDFIQQWGKGCTRLRR